MTVKLGGKEYPLQIIRKQWPRPNDKFGRLIVLFRRVAK